MVGGLVGHAASPQHRSAWAQNRHSKKSRLAAMRGSSSPASVACRIRTRAVGHALRQIGIEGHELMVQLGRVLVDRGEQRRCRRYPRHRGLHVGLVDRDLGGIDGLGDGDPVLDAGAPVLRVHGLAFPERRDAQTKRCRGVSDDPVDMAADATARDGEAELAAIAFLGDQIDPGRAQPADRQILELMADREDPQRLAAEIGTLILGRTGKLELQRAFAGMPQAGCAEIGPGRRGLALGDEGGVDQRVDPLGHGGARVEIQHQNGISVFGGDLRHLGAERLDGDDDQPVHVVLGQLAQRPVPADPLHLGGERAHHGGQRLRFLFGKIDHAQSFPSFEGEGRLAAHGAEPAAGAVWARPVRIEPAEATGAGRADGAERPRGCQRRSRPGRSEAAAARVGFARHSSVAAFAASVCR